MTAIADNIYYYMQQAGYKSQTDLCRASGVPSSTMVRILKSDSHPKIETLIAIADACKVSLDEIVKGKKSPANYPCDVELIYASGEEIRLLTQFREANEMGKNLIRTAGNNAPKKSPVRGNN